MKVGTGRKDLICLVADRDMEQFVKATLARHRALGIREVTSDIRIHPERDPACLRRGHDFLRPFVNRYAHALVALDREGCGREGSSREELEIEIERYLRNNGWQDRAAALVLDPELEIWVWSKSPHVDAVLGWSRRRPGLRTWLEQEGFLASCNVKPERPKEAMERALRLAGKARSSDLYRGIAEKVSLSSCVDPTFLKLKETLRRWFPAAPSPPC